MGVVSATEHLACSPSIFNCFSFLRDDESPEAKSKTDNSIQGMPIGLNPFLDTPQSAAATEHKKGYVMRKCCYDSNYKKSECKKRPHNPSAIKKNSQIITLVFRHSIYVYL